MNYKDILEHEWKIGEVVWVIVFDEEFSACIWDFSKAKVHPVSIGAIERTVRETKENKTLKGVTLFIEEDDGVSKFRTLTTVNDTFIVSSADVEHIFLTKKEAQRILSEKRKEWKEKEKKRRYDEKRYLEKELKRASDKVKSLQKSLDKLNK